MNALGRYDIEDLSIGMSATFSKTLTEADIVLFAGLSGDNNALHINQEYAETTAFAGRIAHGMLTASVLSAAVANKLPGPGAIYLSQSLILRAPVRPGDTVHATVTVRQISTGVKPRHAADHLRGQRLRGHRGRGARQSRRAAADSTAFDGRGK